MDSSTPTTSASTRADHAVGVRPASVLDVVDEHVEVDRLALSGRRPGVVVAADLTAADDQRAHDQGRGHREHAGAPRDPVRLTPIVCHLTL